MKLKALYALLLCLPALGQAAERNDIPDCYGYAKVNEHRQPGSGRELTVIVDQTIPMPESIQKAAWGQINRFVAPGDKIRLYSFSAFLPDQFMQLRFAGELNAPFEGKVRDSIGMQSLRTFDKCVAEQRGFFTKKFGQVFVSTLREASEDIPRSEIFHSLRDIGNDLARHPADERVILLLSDMLENSDFGSFYSANQVRTLDPAAELQKVEHKQLFANLGGARVYVHGAGLVSGAAQGAYRSGNTLQKLEAFWREYLQRSNATLESFGTPALTVDIR